MSKEKILKEFEEWWKKEMGDRMQGSKYLAKKAWLARAKLEIWQRTGVKHEQISR